MEDALLCSGYCSIESVCEGMNGNPVTLLCCSFSGSAFDLGCEMVLYRIGVYEASH